MSFKIGDTVFLIEQAYYGTIAIIHDQTRIGRNFYWCLKYTRPENPGYIYYFDAPETSIIKLCNPYPKSAVGHSNSRLTT